MNFSFSFRFLFVYMWQLNLTLSFWNQNFLPIFSVICILMISLYSISYLPLSSLSMVNCISSHSFINGSDKYVGRRVAPKDNVLEKTKSQGKRDQQYSTPTQSHHSRYSIYLVITTDNFYWGDWAIRWEIISNSWGRATSIISMVSLFNKRFQFLFFMEKEWCAS